ncbi:Transposase (or an inactivated derivative) [Nitrosomonas aestuarii]|uniref:Mutator family transposase n=1 Tax=Nitrosomonas aestuarii TaxID=52441 RepID=A0A1I4EUT0_9PROT|nr:Transposase (or an inactivated derivative) [Nitrosomonas aestuarii]
MLSAAIESEVAAFIQQHGGLKTDDGKKAIVRNGYLSERTIQTGLGGIEVKVPKVRDRCGSSIKFNSSLIPPYLKRTKNIEEFLPWLYLRGVSTGDFTETLKHLPGSDAPGLSAATISRLKQDWEQDYRDWSCRDLSNKRYVYVWADGVYSTVRMDDRLCLLVIIGSDETGRKELLALSDGYRESEASWTEVLMDLKQRGLKEAPKLAVGDSALGFWKAVAKCWPDTDQQRCWVHKTANVMEKLPKAMQPKVKEALHNIWQAETREEAYEAFDHCVERFSPKYPKAMQCLEKDKVSMLAFYDYPAENWQHIRTTNPVESVFATVRLRTAKTKNCGSRTTTLTMAFKLMEAAQKRWFRLRGYKLLADVIKGIKFVNGIKQNGDQKQVAV